MIVVTTFCKTRLVKDTNHVKTSLRSNDDVTDIRSREFDRTNFQQVSARIVVTTFGQRGLSKAIDDEYYLYYFDEY